MVVILWNCILKLIIHFSQNSMKCSQNSEGKYRKKFGIETIDTFAAEFRY